MKNVPKAFKFKTWIFYYLLGISLVLLSACGSGGGGDGGGGGGGSDTTSGTGSLSLNLIFEEPASNFPSGSPAAQSPSGNICVDYGIERIIVDVFDASNTPVASDNWPCSDGHGIIQGVPSGTNIRLMVDGTVGGRNDWQGKIGNLSVFPGEITDAGEVHMKYKGNDIIPPEVVSTDPSDGAPDFPIDADITGTFSEDMVPASVNEDTFTLESDTTITTVEGTVTYDIMTLIATFRPTDDLSYCTTYTATMAADVEDRAGLNMTGDFSWRFTTFADDTNPDHKWYKDSDSDGYSDGTEKISCDKPGDDYFLAVDLKSTSGDCDDNDASINPEAQEVCDGIDNNCNGVPDEDLGTVTCGVGACERTVEACVDGVPQECVPGEPVAEVCDGIDNNCNGVPDEGLETVTCGVGACRRTVEACVDGVPQECVPGEPVAEVCDGIDNNCNGVPDEGLGTVTCGVGACRRTVEACVDGVPQECVPGEPVAEVCDGIDNNCNGVPDEGLGTVTCGVGACERTVEACVDGVPQECVPGEPVAEVCDGIDNNCNGVPDEGLGTVTCGVGACERTVEACVDGVPQECVPGEPVAEVCDGIDNNCNGVPDEGLGTVTCGVGACERTVEACVDGVPQECVPGDPVAEVCDDGIDNNCDGQVDVDCNYPPEFLPIDPFQVNICEEIQLTVIADDPNPEDILTISADLSDLPDEATFIDNMNRTGTFRWAPCFNDFPRKVPSLTFLFGEFGGNLNIEINGDFRIFENFNEINNLNIGGANVSVTNGSGQDNGEVSISGAIIESFAIGGQELWIDDFCYDTGCVDFEDLDVDTTYSVGDSFIDSAANVSAKSFFWSDGTETSSGFARVENEQFAGGSGNEMRCNNVNLDFKFGYTVLFTVTDDGEPPESDAMRISIYSEIENLALWARPEQLAMP